MILVNLGKQTTNFYKLELSTNKCIYKNIELNFNEINKFLPEKYDYLLPILENELQQIPNDNSSVLFPNITLHIALKKTTWYAINKNRIIDPLDLGLKKLKENNVANISLIGSRYTQNIKSLRDIFNNFKIKNLDQKEIKLFDDLRLSVFQNGVKSEDIMIFNKLIQKIENPVIACTELSMLNTENKFLDLCRTQIDFANK